MENCRVSRRKLFLKAWIILCMLLNAVISESQLTGLSACELETLVRELTDPSEEYQIHATALRNQLRNILENVQSENYQTLDSISNAYTEEDKRSLSSLARSGLLQNGKRYLGSLARSGLLGRDVDTIKRSIATLAKNGQLPSREPDVDENSQQWEEKRNLAALARSGYMSGKRNVAALARDYQLPANGKRNLASLVRLGFVPSANPKRNMASLARLNLLPNYNDKRNIGAMARDWSLPNHPPRINGKLDGDSSGEDIKRNIGALKNSPIHGIRQKRELQYDSYNEEGSVEVPEPVMQTSPLDYDELREVMSHLYPYFYSNSNNEEKRFLGSVARSGWLQSQPIDKRNIGSLARLGLLRSDYSNYGAQRSRDLYRQQEQKRHIGALARSGWLPAAFSSRFLESDITPNKSDFDNPSQPFVDDVTSLIHKIPLAGEHLDFNQPGELHLDSQLYTGEVYDPQNLSTNKNISENIIPSAIVNNNKNNNKNNNNYYSEQTESDCVFRLISLFNDLYNDVIHSGWKNYDNIITYIIDEYDI